MPLTRTAVVLTALGGGLLAEAAQAPPKSPEEPFSVYVYTQFPGDPDEGNSLGRTTDEVGKQIQKRRKWFRLAPNQEEADLVVQILDQSMERRESDQYVTRTETDPSAPKIVRFSDVVDTYVLDAWLSVPKGDRIRMKVSGDGPRPRDTAKPFARQLESFCRQNYWTLVEALGR